MEQLAKKGAETGAAFAGSRALQYVKRGNFRKALMWSIPLAAAVVFLMRYRGR